MTREEYASKKRHDYAGKNEGLINPDLRGWYWCLKLVPGKGTCLFHAKTIEELP